MIKTNEYYTVTYKRVNDFKRNILAFFYAISFYPRQIIEAFIRRDMGIRYFSLYHSMRWGIILFLLPFMIPSNYDHHWYYTMAVNWGWYLFLMAYSKFSWDRHKECKKPYGYFDFNHFSKSPGKRLRQIEMFKFRGKLLNERSLDVYLEPLLATGVGIIAFLFGQWMLGVLLTLCSGIYSLSYMAAYQIGRDLMLDDIDKSIVNRWISDSFLNDKPSTSNFKFFGPKPSTAEAREGFAALFAKDDDGTDVK